jgi:NADH-quinone oxidoreductase subunit K
MGVWMALTKKHLILILIGIELMFNAANLNLVAIGRQYNLFSGQIFVIFIIMIAVCETAVALAIILNFYRYFKGVTSESISTNREN